METCVDLFLGSALVEASRGLSAFVENCFAATSMIESACRGPSAFVEVERGNNSGASDPGRVSLVGPFVSGFINVKQDALA